MACANYLALGNLYMVPPHGNFQIWKWYRDIECTNPDSKVHGGNMGPIWDRQDPGGAHVGPLNLAIWEQLETGDLYFHTCLMYTNSYQ